MESHVLEMTYLLRYSLGRHRVRRLRFSPYWIYQTDELEGTPDATGVRTADDSCRKRGRCPGLPVADQRIS